MLLPDGFVLPPIPIILLLLVAAGVVGYLLIRSDPEITQYTVLALGPWMGLGGALHVLDVLALVPTGIRSFVAAPAVYVTTAIIAGGVWFCVTRPVIEERLTPSPSILLGSVGLLGLGIVATFIGISGYITSLYSLWWPFVSLVLGCLITFLVWVGFRYLSPEASAITRWSGILVIFGHVLDGVSTSVGVDVLGMGERTPLPLQIMEFAETLPVAEFIGVGWIFLLLKIAISVLVVWLFADFVEEQPRQAFLLLALIAAVGLGPAVHNLLLFMVIG